jgi:hypothetical protein
MDEIEYLSGFQIRTNNNKSYPLDLFKKVHLDAMRFYFEDGKTIAFICKKLHISNKTLYEKINIVKSIVKGAKERRIIAVRKRT